MTNQPETAVTVDALARMLSAADVEINHGDYPTWDTLAESGQKQYRQAARYLLKRLHITAPAAVSAAVTPPTNRAALRETVAETLARTDGWTWAHGLQFKDISTPSADAYRKLADAVLALLPSADRLRRMADETATETPVADATHPCNAATMHRLGNLATAHGPHLWVMQPGMDPVRCPGTRKPAAGARQDGAES